MNKFIIASLYLCIINMNASDTEHQDITNHQPDMTLINNYNNQGEVPQELHIDMDQFTQSMPGGDIVSPHLFGLNLHGTKEIAQYLTQVAHKDTIAQATFITGPVREQLKRIKRENPTKYVRILNQLGEHKTKAMRGININGATEALQKEITPEMVGLLIDAWQASHTQQTGTITEQEEAARSARIKFWCAIGTTLVGAAGTVVAAIFAGTGTC